MIDYTTIKPYIEKKLINEQVHPEDENVRIFNYTQKCQFEKEWDEVTKQCRGLIMNVETGEILARPFPKFFNVGEHTDVYGLTVPDEIPIITEKYDGSLGIMYTFNGETRIATRGSFTSDQALWATKWWHENKGPEPYGNDQTHLFEIIYPENRIVVKYEFSGLVHIGTLDTKTGVAVKAIMPVKTVEYIQPMDLRSLAGLNKENAEGFVIYYPKAELRLKVKFEEYVRLHKIVTGFSVIGVWEYLSKYGVGANIRIMAENAPDEFYEWLDGISEEIRKSYQHIESEAKRQFSIIPDCGDNRKDWADHIKQMDQPGIGFAMLDKKDYKPLIWKMIRPKGNVTFKIDE
ncbi:hypothetical protein KAR91_72405 [Candidatus Pacearchaeota archaeon]|nr:hypothetical protein [Candidatus Pacearchaeota archaeon]